VLHGKSDVFTRECKKQLGDFFSQKGIQNQKTADRFVDLFLKSSGHVSIDDFTALLRDHGTDLDSNLVYEGLDFLSRLGFARELHFEGEIVKRYEPLRTEKHHDHFICLKCKKIVEFSDSELETYQDSLVLGKCGRPLYHKFEVYGICDACSPKRKTAVPVTYVPEGSRVKFCRLKGGWRLKRRLTELGFVPEEAVTVLKNSGFGPVVLKVKNARLAIGRAEAQNIFVYE